MSMAFRPPIHPYCERRFRKPAQTVYLFSYLFVLKYRILLLLHDVMGTIKLDVDRISISFSLPMIVE